MVGGSGRQQSSRSQQRQPLTLDEGEKRRPTASGAFLRSTTGRRRGAGALTSMTMNMTPQSIATLEHSWFCSLPFPFGRCERTSVVLVLQSVVSS